MGQYIDQEFFDTLTADDCVLGVDGSGDVLTEYEVAEIALFRSRFGDVAALLLEYDSLACFERFVNRATRGLEGLVDDNSGRLREFPMAL